MSNKPLGHKSYGSIPHLAGSRRGPGDHGLNDGQARICLETCRPGDIIVVQEKLDGSNVSIARVDGQIVALGRSGYRAESSRWEQHQLFAAWVRERADGLFADLPEGWRLCGEWMAQAHGTRYSRVWGNPFVAFDLMRGTERAPYDLFEAVAIQTGMAYIPAVHKGGPISIEAAMAMVQEIDLCGAGDEGVEGAVWPVENGAHVDFLAKYVRPEKVDGVYLPEISGLDPVWNWRPPSRRTIGGRS